MDIHITSNNPSNSLPQGFSVYQPTLGAQLQFFPAMGTKELDDMLHAYLPGPASLADKRAAVSVDFLEHLHLTGQTFKFYQVDTLTAAPVTSASSSPASASGASSMSGFPATPTWDFNTIAFTPSSTSSQTSASAHKARKSTKVASVSRHQTTDFSHLPGMKIMTKDGIDVTNAASRGSKTKEQRDHAHLMRIIKACDSCRAKKIRCDPSHKRRATSTASSSVTSLAPPPSNSRQKRQKTVSKTAQPTITESLPVLASSLAPLQDFNWDDFDASLAMADVEYFDDFTKLHDPWSEFIDFPENVPGVFEDLRVSGSDDHASPLSSLTPTTVSSGSFTKPHSPSDVLLSGDTTASGHVVTNRRPPANDNHDTWSQELGLASATDSILHTQRNLQTMGVDDGFAHVAVNDRSRVPGDHDLDTTLLVSTGMAFSQHRLDDPGTNANATPSLELSGDATLSSIQTIPSLMEGASSSLEPAVRRALLLPQPLVGTQVSPTSTTLHDPAQTLLCTSASGSDVRRVPTAMQTRRQTRGQTLVGISDRAGLLGLLPMSGPVIPGLAQLMLGGTSELIATSAPLSSRSLAMLFAALAFMATSFVSSVDNMFAHVCRDPISPIRHRQQPRSQSAVQLSQRDRCMAVGNSMAMSPVVASVC